MELCLKTDEEPPESLWVRISGQTHMDNIAVGVCYIPPGQEEDVDEAFFRQVKDASCF